MHLYFRAPHEAEPSSVPAVGAVMGWLRMLRLSDGTQIDNPRWLRDGLAELRRAQRRLARAGGGRRNPARPGEEEQVGKQQQQERDAHGADRVIARRRMVANRKNERPGR